MGRIAESRLRFAAIIANAENRKFTLLLSTANFWLAKSDFLQNQFSETTKNLKKALQVAEASGNIFEAHHAAESLVVTYTELGELEPSVSYAGIMLSHSGSTYENPSQSLRDLSTLSGLCLKSKLNATALNFALESLSMIRQSMSDSPNSKSALRIKLTDSLRRLVEASIALKNFPMALKFGDEAMQEVQNRENGAEKTKAVIDVQLLLAEARRLAGDCPSALRDYDQALAANQYLPEVSLDLYQLHKGKLFCYQEQNDQERIIPELETVLALSEKYRMTIREDSSRQSFFANEQDVFDVATEQALRQGDTQQAFDYVESAKARSLLDFVESGKSIAEVEKSFGAVTRPLTLREIQSRLPDEVQAIQYSVLPDRLVAWTISRDSVAFFETQITADELEQKVADYQTAILKKAKPAEIREAARELYDLLIPQGLNAGKQLCLLPDAVLHELAFASLVSPNGRYLIQEFALSYSPSASVLVFASENARTQEAINDERLLSVGNPTFDREENPNLSDLHDAESEARTVAVNYHGASLLLSSDATRSAFLGNLSNVNVVHFAGHFLPNHDSPGKSRFLFADGELSSSELSAYRLSKAKLVVLSACETGLEHYNKSEGAIGVARIFLALGAPQVVASQWKVDSEATKDLMIALHQNRKLRSLNSVESLRQAQLKILNDEKTSSPFYWAAFALFGGYAKY